VNDKELGFCIGLFEGEGFVGTSYRKTKGSRYRSIRLRITMCDLHPLELFQAFTDLGKIYGPYYPANSKHSSYYCYEISNFEEVKSVCDSLYDWLSPRRQQQINKAIERHENYFKGESPPPEGMV
jgi:hypothetical protein